MGLVSESTSRKLEAQSDTSCSLIVLRIAFSFQRYFESQVEEGRRISQ